MTGMLWSIRASVIYCTRSWTNSSGRLSSRSPTARGSRINPRGGDAVPANPLLRMSDDQDDPTTLLELKARLILYLPDPRGP